MRPGIKIIISACAIGITVFASCKKKSNSPAFIGNWKMTQYAIDANGNGIMDADEVVNDSSNTVMTFNSNGMGNLTDFSGYSSPFKWAAESNNWLKITDDTLGTSYYLHIDQLTASTLVFKDTLSGGVAEWTIFAKQ